MVHLAQFVHHQLVVQLAYQDIMYLHPQHVHNVLIHVPYAPQHQFVQVVQLDIIYLDRVVYLVKNLVPHVQVPQQVVLHVLIQLINQQPVAIALQQVNI